VPSPLTHSVRVSSPPIHHFGDHDVRASGASAVAPKCDRSCTVRTSRESPGVSCERAGDLCPALEL